MSEIEHVPALASAPSDEFRRTRLAHLERVVEHGMRAFVAAGRALRQIRDERLYEPEYRSFREYVSGRWSRGQAYRMIDAVEVIEVAGDAATVIATESQARELTPLLRSHPEPDAAVQRVLKIVSELAPRPTARAIRAAVAEELALPPDPNRNAVHFSRDADEWRTPTGIVERVVRALGSIDLDPCSDAERSIPATTHFTLADDGLSHEWRGMVFVNPPYGVAIGQWVAHLLREYRAGRATAAVVLLPARTDTGWFASLRDYPRCFLRGRLRFEGAVNSAPFPSCVFYVGGDPEAFAAAFGDLGDIYGVPTPALPTATEPAPNELAPSPELPTGLHPEEAAEVLRRYAALRQQHGDDITPDRMARATSNRADRVRRERESEERRASLKVVGDDASIGDVRLIHSDFRDLDIPAGSVDLIVTDPPYSRENLPLFSDLGEFAARVLTERGYLVCYTGSYFEQQAVSAVAEHVPWWWRCTVPMAQRQTAHGRGFIIDHKPLHVFRRSSEPLRGGRALPSTLPTGAGASKDYHEWGQAIAEAEYLVKHLSPPGALVVDPMCGGGTVPLAAYRLGRRAIGIEVDAASYAVAVDRLRTASKHTEFGR